MSKRQLHPQPFKLPPDLVLPVYPAAFKQNYSHIPGQAAIIRFFDPDSDADYQAMKAIVTAKQSQVWMDDSRSLPRSEYYDWAGTTTNDSFLFAVHSASATTDEELAYIRGFVYFYSERSEKFRVKRMEKMGFFTPNQPHRHALEVSFAARPLPDQTQQGSGLMSSALRQACFQVKNLINPARQADVQLFGFVDPDNFPAQRTLTASGFIKKGTMKYDPDSEDVSLLYVLSWRRLTQKTTQKLREAIAAQTLTKSV